MQTHSLGNILKVDPVDPTLEDFTDEHGFFIRAEIEGYLTFCPFNNKSDAEAITKWFDASYIFIDPVLCRKIFSIANSSFPEVSPEAEQAQNIYAGYGV